MQTPSSVNTGAVKMKIQASDRIAVKQWLTKNIAPTSDNSINMKANVLYNDYSSAIETPITFYGFNKITQEIFPTAQKDQILENSKPFIIFRGVQKITNSPSSYITVENVFATLDSHGFQIMLNSNQSCSNSKIIHVYKIMPLQSINSQRVICELSINLNENNIYFVVGSKEIYPDGLPTSFSSIMQLSSILSELNQRIVCTGFSICPEIKQYIADSELEIWNNSPPSTRSRNCEGLMHIQRRNKVCCHCIQTKSRLRRKSALKNHNVLHNNSSTTNKRSKPATVPHIRQGSVPAFWSDISESDFSDDEENDPSYCESNRVQQEEVDTSSIQILIKELAPDLDPAFIQLVDGQIKNGNVTNKRLRRWDLSTIQLCLSVWSIRPKAYQQLRGSQILLLPSTRQLQRYKNSIPQEPGFCSEVFNWMLKEAQRRKIPPSGYVGGIIFDEMSIQEDLDFKTKLSTTPLVGFTDFGKEVNELQSIRFGPDHAKLASHVLQMVFLGDGGFRWPFAHFPTVEATASDLYMLFWDAVQHLTDWGFTVSYACMDGSVHNRTFIKMHFEGDPADHDFTTPNITDPTQKIVFIMDPSHSFKKIRNSVIKSGTAKLVQHEKGTIMWDHFKDAYNWDLESNPMRLHYKLTDNHLNPDQAEKMRNHLAMEVLNKEMLNLMKAYQEDSDRGDLVATIEFLEKTSVLVDFYSDKRPVRSVEDDRLQAVLDICKWFIDWHSFWVKGGKKQKSFITRECYEDILSMILGTKSLIQIKLSLFPLSCMYMCRLNSDVIENVFCSQRGICNGANANPSYYKYCKGMNSICIGQAVVSKKSNAGGEVCVGGAVPYKCHSGMSFKSLRL